MQPREKELARKTVKQLQVIAGELDVRGRKGMRHDDLVKAILAAEEEEELEPFGPPSEDEQSEDEEEENEQETTQARNLATELSLENYQRIRQAPTDRLQIVLEDPNLERPLREAVGRELDRRLQVEAERKRQAELRTAMTRYRVTKGGTYIVEGHITTLPPGSVVGPLTHDLREVKAQGIEFVPVEQGIMLGEDQLGNQTSRVI